MEPVTTATPTSNPPTIGTGRQIRFWGSAARLIVGAGMLIAAWLTGADQLDVLIGLVALPVVEVVVLALRGPNASPLRLYGNLGHCVNWGVGIAAFTFLSPQAALLFYGISIMLAFVRGYAGCEIFAISNWLRRRDDQIVCPLFSPIDQLEARRAGSDPAC